MTETNVVTPLPLHAAQGDAEAAAVTDNYATFQLMLHDTAEQLRTGDPDVAAVFAEISANIAMSHHPGIFASAHLERMLQEIGRTLPPPPSRNTSARPRNDGKPRVLHLMTTAAGIGGDARLVWRWVQQDSGRVHSLMLTRQGAQPLPVQLHEAIAAAGGEITVLNQHRGSLRRWAALLRSAAASADFIVLHIHPYDIIPVIALAGMADAPPVIFVDHADHAFWVGASVTNVVASLRESGARIARDRRGFVPEQVALLPTILRPLEREYSRIQAKAILGLDPKTVVLLSIARPHKYSSQGEESFLDGVIPVIAADPNTALIVIGPDNADAWKAAHDCTDGRIVALGPSSETALYYQAADIYVDSFPIVSITSLLEAGSYGLPLISRCMSDDDPGILGADAPGISPHLIRTHRIAEFREALTTLIGDAPLRERIGEQTRLEITRLHTGCGWQQSLEALYERAATTPPHAVLPHDVDTCRIEWVDTMLPVFFASEPGVTEIVRFHVRLLPLRPRLQTWLRVLAQRERFYPGLLLPEWLGVRFERRRLQRAVNPANTR